MVLPIFIYFYHVRRHFFKIYIFYKYWYILVIIPLPALIYTIRLINTILCSLFMDSQIVVFYSGFRDKSIKIFIIILKRFLENIFLKNLTKLTYSHNIVLKYLKIFKSRMNKDIKLFFFRNLKIYFLSPHIGKFVKFDIFY